MTRQSLTLVACTLFAVRPLAGEVDMVRLAGTPTEIGEIWGAANKAAIVRDMEVFYLHKAADAAISEDALIERSGMFLRIAHEVAPHWLDDARAIARAAGVHEDLYLGFLADAVRSLFLHECTSYSVSREYTLGGANYWIEISRLSAVLANEIGQLIKCIGYEHIVFGTGMPFTYPDPALLKLEVLDAPEEVKEAIRWKNAASILGLK